MTQPCLILVDIQRGLQDEAHWGGTRSTPEMEERGRDLLAAFRRHRLPILHVAHHSLSKASPLRLEKPTGGFIDGFAPAEGEPLFVKRVNSGFIGTDLDGHLRRSGLRRLVVAGLTTDHCVSTTVRMAANLGYQVTLAADACAAFGHALPDGRRFDGTTIHLTALASLHGEFATVRQTADILAELDKAAA